ncbi:MAG: hypothetical protein IJ501_02765 [Bacilli bacterium]|nr:hypothetical protein [Bacilli bacterium]
MEKKKNNLIPIVIILIVLVLGLGGFIVYDKVLKNDANNSNTNYTLNVLKSDISYCNSNNDNTCKDVVYTIKTETSDATFVKSDNGFILYDDNGLKIYNAKTKEIKNIDLENNYIDYNLYLNNEKNEVAGIVYKLQNNKVGYYNVLKNMKLYDGQYELINFLDENYINAINASIDDSTSYLLNTNEEKIELSENFDDACGFYYSLQNYKDKYYFFERRGCNSDFINKIYDNNKQVIFDGAVENYKVSVVADNLYLVDNNVVKKYDINGNLVSTNKSFDNIIDLIDKYVVYKNKNNLYISNFEKNDNKLITAWQDNYYYDQYTSGYYDRETLDSMGENEKFEGIYLVINYETQDANGDYGIEYCYDAETNELKTYNIKEPVGGRAKPVLYLYPTKSTNVKVSFQYPEYLTTTYPKYNDGWEVLANPNGDLFDKDNKYYYALYWDETRYNEVNFDEGFYVTKENAIDFLEEKLEIIGLNNKERNEFIMYWLPILENNEKSLVYFELTEEREKSNKLIIEPTPDSLLRVSIHIKRVNDYTKIKEQKLTSFERNGFVAVEWGGMTY